MGPGLVRQLTLPLGHRPAPGDSKPRSGWERGSGGAGRGTTAAQGFLSPAPSKMFLVVTRLYFSAEEGGERSVCLTFAFLFLLLAMLVQVVQEETLELGLEPGMCSVWGVGSPRPSLPRGSAFKWLVPPAHNRGRSGGLSMAACCPRVSWGFGARGCPVSWPLMAACGCSSSQGTSVPLICPLPSSHSDLIFIHSNLIW